MRLTRLLTSILLPSIALAAKSKATTSTFDKYHSKALSSSPVQLDDQSFSDLQSVPRDYGFVVCLTALAAQFGCQICQDFAPEWRILANSWIKADKSGDKRVVFGTLDFLDGKQTFQAMRLETAPVVLYFPPTTGPYASPSGSAAPIKYEFAGVPPTADTVQAWLSRHMSSSVTAPPIRRPINYVKIATVTTIVLGVVTLLFVAWPYALPIIQSRNLWAALSIVAILLFTSGHMYNHIRGVPYVASDGKGGISYFAGGFQNQYGMESQIVAGLYGVLAFATISLAVKVPRMQDPKYQQTACFVWVGVTYGVYAFLMSIFKIKNGGYPYSLPPFR